MAEIFNKITESDYGNKGVRLLPSRVVGDAATIQRVFDELSLDVLIPSVNAIVDSLNSLNIDMRVTSDDIKGLRLNSDNVIEVTLDGVDWITVSDPKDSVESLKIYLVGYADGIKNDLEERKADKSNVLEKDNTEEYIPTNQYNPATKRYVDLQVFNSSAADMTKVVYDPNGKETDIFAYAEEMVKNNEPMLQEIISKLNTLEEKQNKSKFMIHSDNIKCKIIENADIKIIFNQQGSAEYREVYLGVPKVGILNGTFKIKLDYSIQFENAESGVRGFSVYICAEPYGDEEAKEGIALIRPNPTKAVGTVSITSYTRRDGVKRLGSVAVSAPDNNVKKGSVEVIAQVCSGYCMDLYIVIEKMNTAENGYITIENVSICYDEVVE